MTLPGDIWYGTRGPRNAPIMVVGESWGSEEHAAGVPFVGASGQELKRMFEEAGYDLTQCFLTNVVPHRPDGNDMGSLFLSNDVVKTLPDLPFRGLYPGPLVREGWHRLRTQIEEIQPKLIVACGNYALWALTNCTGSPSIARDDGATVKVPSGIDDWRGSQWYAEAIPHLAHIKVLPILHPASILRAWYNRAVTVHDLRTRIPLALADRWRPDPEPVFLAPPTFNDAVNCLNDWLNEADFERIRILCDIETVKRQIVTVVGFSDGTRTTSIPWVKNGNLEPYWTFDEEFTLFRLIRKVLSHPNILVEGQNFSYDVQYFRRYFGVTPHLAFDSMLAHHLLFPGTPKDLGYLSSLYCEHHWYWKDDGKEWNGKGSIADLCLYNAWDCIRNFEINTTLRRLIPEMGLEEQWGEVMETAALLQKMMFRGVRIDRKRRAEMAFDLAAAASSLEEWFERIIPQRVFTDDKKKPTPWYRSSTQQRNGFRDVFGMNLPKHKKTGNATFGKEALTVLRTRHPEYVRLFDALAAYRSISVFRSTFVDASLDIDDRMRCSYNAAGTETFRFSSSENAFGSGTNLQNIPKGNEDNE